MKGTRNILGISVGSTHYDGVLLEATESGLVVVERFSAPRRDDDMLSPDFSAEEGALEALPGVTVQLDASPGQQESTEFAGTADISEAESVAVRRTDEAMDQVIQVWLSRARQLGYERVSLAAVITEPEIGLHPVRLTTSSDASQVDAGDGRLSWSDRRTILKALRDQVPEKVDPNRVGFLRLAADSPEGDFVAMLDTAASPLVPALTKLSQQRWRRHLRPHRIDADVALFGALIRRWTETDALSHVALVRVGVDDTQIVFYRRGTPLSFERVPTLTIYTEPATVASRILLLQDSLRIPKLDNVFVVDDTPEQKFLVALRSEFGETAVREFADLVKNIRFEKRTPRGVMSAGQWMAAAAAWEHAHEDPAEPDRPSENLLPASLKRRFESFAAAAWHTWLALVLLLVVVVGQGYRYQSQKTSLENDEREFATMIGLELPGGQSIEELRAILAARLDSLRAAQDFAQRSVRFMDSLTTGAERWTHFLIDLGAASQSEAGMWFTEMEPIRGEPLRHVRLEGFSFRQEQVAQLSRTLDATIEFMAVSRETGRRLFTFLLTAPVPNEDSPAKQFFDDWIQEQLEIRLSTPTDSTTQS